MLSSPDSSSCSWLIDSNYGCAGCGLAWAWTIRLSGENTERAARGEEGLCFCSVRVPNIWHATKPSQLLFLIVTLEQDGMKAEIIKNIFEEKHILIDCSI